MGETKKILVNGVLVDVVFSDEEIAALRTSETRLHLEEKSRPLTGEEVTRLIITETINTLSLDDNTALRAMAFYPEWKPNTAYTVEYKVQRNGKLWRTIQAHTSQTGWEPGATGTESLWEQINETHAGTLDDPIPYDGNMSLTAGLYYYQDWIIYLCTRDTVNPVYHPLSELVGLYVEVV